MTESESKLAVPPSFVEQADAFQELIEELYVPKIKSGFDEPVNISEFDEYTNTIDFKLTGVLDALNTVTYCASSNNLGKLKKKILSTAIIFRGQHTCEKPWTTKFTIEKSETLVKNILEFFGYYFIKDALIDDNCYIFKDILQKMRPWLLKESWKHYPAGIACYMWVIKKIESPHLSDLLNVVLPTAFIITDDFESENRIIGLNCLEHIIEQVGMTHLSWYGQDKVVMKAIEPLFYFKDVEIIPSLSSTFVALLKKKYPLIAHPSLQINEFDDLIDRFLQNMILEQKLALRSASLAALPAIISARGLGMVLHSTNLKNILDEYIVEPTSTLQALQVLECYIDVCWPRIHTHCSVFIVTICKVYLGIQTKRFPEECRDLVMCIVSKLNKLCPKEVELFFYQLRQNETLKHLAVEVCKVTSSCP